MDLEPKNFDKHPEARTSTGEAAKLKGLSSRRSGFGVAASATAPADLSRLNPRELREVSRRQSLIKLVDDLVAKGWTQAKAAKVANVSVTSLWRWRQRIAPRLHYCGPASVFNTFGVPDDLIATVQRLRIGGLSNPAAWRALAQDRTCPNDLATYLRLAPKIHTSFLAASRLKKRQVTLIEGTNFTHVAKPKPQ